MAAFQWVQCSTASKRVRGCSGYSGNRIGERATHSPAGERRKKARRCAGLLDPRYAASEAPGSRQPQCVSVVDGAGIDLFVCQAGVQVIEESRSHAEAVEKILVAAARAEYIAAQIVEVGSDVDVVVVVTHFCEQLHRSKR